MQTLPYKQERLWVSLAMEKKTTNANIASRLSWDCVRVSACWCWMITFGESDRNQRQSISARHTFIHILFSGHDALQLQEIQYIFITFSTEGEERCVQATISSSLKEGEMCSITSEFRFTELGVHIYKHTVAFYRSQSSWSFIRLHKLLLF